VLCLLLSLRVCSWLADTGPITAYSNKVFKDSIRKYVRKTHREHAASIHKAQDRARAEMRQLDQRADQMAAQLAGGSASETHEALPPAHALRQAKQKAITKKECLVEWTVGPTKKA
jgi:hypothetical protein